MDIYRPYTYLIGWSALNIWYYGVRFAKNCTPDDLWVKYFTSSKHVKEFRKLHGDPDVVEIRKEFTNKQDALLWEHKVLRRLGVKSRNDFLNRSIGFGDMCADVSGIQKSEEHKRKISEANKGIKRPHSQEMDSKRASTVQDMSITERFKKFGLHMVELSEEGRLHLSLKSSKHTYEFISPTGEKFIHHSIKMFCNEYSLNSDVLYKMVNCGVVPVATHSSLSETRKRTTGWSVITLD